MPAMLARYGLRVLGGQVTESGMATGLGLPLALEAGVS
jgi:hypothetical protein